MPDTKHVDDADCPAFWRNRAVNLEAALNAEREKVKQRDNLIKRVVERSHINIGLHTIQNDDWERMVKIASKE